MISIDLPALLKNLLVGLIEEQNARKVFENGVFGSIACLALLKAVITRNE